MSTYSRPHGGVTRSGILHEAYAVLIAISSLVRIERNPYWDEILLAYMPL